MIIDPIGYEVQEWTDYVGDELSSFGTVGKLLDPNEWQTWASAICNFSGIASQQPPNPWSYNDWLEWALAFNQVVRY